MGSALSGASLEILWLSMLGWRSSTCWLEKPIVTLTLEVIGSTVHNKTVSSEMWR